MNGGVSDTVTGTSSPYSFAFNVSNLTVSDHDHGLPRHGRRRLGVQHPPSGSAPDLTVTTTLAADFSFSVDDEGNFSLSVSSMTVTAAVDTGNSLNFNVNFGFLGGAVQDGNVDLSAGISISFGGASTSITTSQLNADASNIASNGQSSLVTLSDATNSLSAALPVEFLFDGQDLSRDPMPEIDLTDPNLFSGNSPDVSTQNFANLVNFSNLTATDVLGNLGQLGGWIQQVENSPVFGATIPFTDETMGDVIDLGAVFSDKLITGLVNIQSPDTAPQVLRLRRRRFRRIAGRGDLFRAVHLRRFVRRIRAQPAVVVIHRHGRGGPGAGLPHDPRRLHDERLPRRHLRGRAHVDALSLGRVDDHRQSEPGPGRRRPRSRRASSPSRCSPPPRPWPT